MAEHQLHTFVTQILLEHITDHALKVDDDEHFVCLSRSTCEVEAPGLELVDTVGPWIKFLIVVYKLRELVLHAPVVVI